MYAAFNRRISKTVDGISIFYIHDGDQIVEERDASGNLNATFLYGSGIDEILAMFRGGNLYAYHHDALGSVDAIIDWAGNPAEFTLYDVYGNPSTTNSSIGNPFLFTGRQYDPETGLYYYRNRMYDPTLGRFLQRDPIGYYDSMNLMQYVGNSPTNYVDPLGLWGVQFGSTNFGVGTPTFLFGEGSGNYFTQTLAATADGFIPFADPFSSSYDSCDKNLGISKTLGGISRDALLSAAFAGLFNLGKQVTVLGSRADTLKYLGKPGYNVLNLENWTANANIKWLSGAVRRGDIIKFVTDPIAHAKLMAQLGKSSKFLDLEIPYLQFLGIIPK